MKCGCAFFAIKMSAPPKSGITIKNNSAISTLIVSVIIHDRITIIGALAKRRILIIYAICTFVMSVVILVTKLGVEKRSIFLNEKSCILYPAPAIAANFPASTPNQSASIAITTRIAPIFTMYPKSPLAIPTSIIFAICNGIKTSINTSRITKSGASTDCFLYSRIDFSNVLFIVFVFLLFF